MCNPKIISTIVLSLLFITGCQTKEKVKVQEAIAVSVYEVRLGTIQETIDYVGNIKAQDEAIVYPKVSGKIIQKIKEEGSFVNKDDAIAYIDRDEIGLKFEKAPVESPLDGIVGEVYVDIGSKVSPQSPVALVVNMEEVKVEINVIERDLPKIKLGQIAYVKVDAYPQEIFEGKVEKISPIVDLVWRTSPIEIEIPNSDYRLKPGMFARIKILIRGKQNVLIIPRDAIIKEDGLRYVFIVDKDNKVHQQKIELGLHENNKFEVINGLAEGQIVVTMGNIRLKEGDTVEIIQ